MKITETHLIDFIAGLSPWLAPLPTAYLVGRATIRHLAWPWWVALVAAAIIECLGLASVATALLLRDYNHTRRKTDPHAPLRLALALVVLYIIVATGLTVALDIAPSLAVYAPAIFPALSIVGATILAIRADHRRRLANIAGQKAERKAARKEAQDRKQLPEPERATERHKAAQVPEYATISGGTREAARAILAERPGISGAELGRTLGRSPRLGRKLKAELAELLPELLPELPEPSDDGRGPRDATAG